MENAPGKMTTMARRITPFAEIINYYGTTALLLFGCDGVSISNGNSYYITIVYAN